MRDGEREREREKGRDAKGQTGRSMQPISIDQFQHLGSAAAAAAAAQFVSLLLLHLLFRIFTFDACTLSLPAATAAIAVMGKRLSQQPLLETNGTCVTLKRIIKETQKK